MTPIPRAAFDFVAMRRFDRSSGRFKTVDLREISEPMRQRIIDLGMMEPPLVSVDGTWVYLTGEGFLLSQSLSNGERA
jgi:hypothetical protein